MKYPTVCFCFLFMKTQYLFTWQFILQNIESSFIWSSIDKLNFSIANTSERLRAYLYHYYTKFSLKQELKLLLAFFWFVFSFFFCKLTEDSNSLFIMCLFIQFMGKIFSRDEVNRYTFTVAHSNKFFTQSKIWVTVGQCFMFLFCTSLKY